MTEVRAANRGVLIVAFAAVYILWGSTYLAIRFADATMPPLLMGGTRFLIAGAILFGLAWLREGARPTLANWRATAIVGAFLLLGGNGMVILAERVVPSSLAALLVSTTPLWMILVDWLRPHGVRPSVSAVIGVIIGFGGVALLLGPNVKNLPPLDIVSFVLIPCAALSWAIGSVYARGAKLPQSPALSSGMEMLAGGALLLLVGTVTGEWPQVHLAAISMSSIVAWLFLIIFGSLAGFTAYAYVLRNSPLAVASTYAYVNPVVAVFLGWWLAHETVTPLTLIAAATIIGSVIIITTFRPHPTAARTAEVTTAAGEGPPLATLTNRD